ncbi:MAG: hypothetical protein ABR958_03795 [Dehalococcoidales bacterium]
MKITIKLRNQDKPTVIDNVQVAQQRVPMYLITCGETHYRYAMDGIEWVKEEGVKSIAEGHVCASEADAPEPETGDTSSPSKKTPYRHTGAKKVNIDLSLLEGKLDLGDGKSYSGETYSMGEIGTRIGKILGIGETQSYKIVNQLIAERKIRRSKDIDVKGRKCYEVVDPVLNPNFNEVIRDLPSMNMSLEEYLNKEYY